MLMVFNYITNTKIHPTLLNTCQVFMPLLRLMLLKIESSNLRDAIMNTEIHVSHYYKFVGASF